MNPDHIDLARRAVACQRWRWVPGMLAVVPPAYFGSTGYILRMEQPPARAYPDLSDHATLGCLLALVREAWGNPRLVAIYCEPANPGQSEGWAVQRADNRLPVAGENYATEAEALVAALEAAP